jgi:pyruvate, water dikinase
MLMEDLATSWALGVGVPTRGKYWKEKAEKRKAILAAASKWNAVPALGVPPEEVSEPFTIMLWGVTTDKVDEWLKGTGAEDKDITESKGSPHPRGWRKDLPGSQNARRHCEAATG